MPNNDLGWKKNPGPPSSGPHWGAILIMLLVVGILLGAYYSQHGGK